MKTNYYDRKSVYDYVYVFCKFLVILIICSMISYLSFGITLPIIIFIISNFIENGFSYSFNLFKSITIKNITLLLLYVLLFHTVLFVYVNSIQLYSGITLNIIRGLNMFVMFELLLALMYAPKFTFHQNQNLIEGLKNSLIISNYKIAISMLTALIIGVSAMVFIIVFEGQFLLLSPMLIMLWQLISSKLYEKYVFERKV